MKTQLNEIKRMQQLAGLLIESEEEDPSGKGLQRMRPRTSGEIAWEDLGLDKYVAKVLSNNGFTTKDGTKVNLKSADQLVKWVMSILNKKLPNASQETKQWIEQETKKKYNDPTWNKNISRSKDDILRLSRNRDNPLGKRRWVDDEDGPLNTR